MKIKSVTLEPLRGKHYSTDLVVEVYDDFGLEVTIDEAFEEWLDGWMVAETRREFAKKTGANFDDLRWAFIAGYTKGQDSMMEKK